MRPIKAHELSHSGAMAQLMQRRAGRISRSRQPITTCSEAP